MITYATVSSHGSVMVFTEAKHVEDFTARFTTLDPTAASRAIFSHDVRIVYHDGNRVELIPDKKFTYCSIRSMIDHMLNHGFSFKSGVLSEILTQACELEMDGTIVLRSSCGSPSYTVSMCRNVISLYPASELYIDYTSGLGKKLLDALKSEGSPTGCSTPEIKGKFINITDGGNIRETLAALSNALVRAEAIPQSEEKLVLKQMTSLAFLDFTGSELKIVQNIASYPSTHPLSKYRDVAKTVEHILRCLRDEVCDQATLARLEDALEQRGEFSGAPPLLMKGFTKLSRDFSTQLENIVSQARTAAANSNKDS
ncbi:MAG: hypothetical protein ACTJLL_02980 [Anaplasma sp.]